MLRPCRLDQFGNAAPVTNKTPVALVDLRHAFCSASAALSQGLLRQFTQETAPGGSATTCLDIDRPKQVIG
jgi:hypothetical protein